MTPETIMHSFSVTSANIAITRIFLRTRFFGLHFCCRQYGFIFNHVDVIDPPKHIEFGKITQNNGHYVENAQNYVMNAHVKAQTVV